MTPELTNDLELISGLLEGKLADDDLALLEERLANSAETRLLYYQLVDYEVELECAFHDEQELALAEEGRTNKQAIGMVLGTILCALVAAALWFAFRLVDPPAVVEEKPDPAPGEAVNPAGGSPQEFARPIPPGAESWIVDFNEGLPLGWSGRLVTADLLPGSTGALGMVDKVEADKTLRQIIPPMAWDPGRVRVQSNSHLKLVCKIKNPRALSIFILAHVPDPKRDARSMYQLPLGDLVGGSDRWQRVQIPLSQFRRKDTATDTFGPGGPEENEVIWQLFFSSPDAETDLIIDRWELVPSGPGAFQVEEL